MRRILSVILTVALVFALTLNVFAKISQEDCNDLIGNLEILDADSYTGEKVVTKGEFAEILAEMMGIKGANVYEDLENLYALNAIGKDASGSFRETEPLTYDEAILGLLTATEFSQIAALSGGYPKGYEKIAIRYGLVCSKNGSQSLTYDDLTTLIYNAMYLPWVETVYSENHQDYYINDNEKAMEKLFDMKEKSGILNACGSLNIYSQRELDEDMVEIDGVKFKNVYDKCRDMVGRRVTVFYKTQDDINTVVFAYEEARNEVIVITDEKEIEYASRRYTYSENKKVRKISVENDAAYVYNGHLPSSRNDMKFVPDNGWIEFIDNDGNSKADVVKIFDYSNYYITGISQCDDGAMIYSENENPVLIKDGLESGNTHMYTADGKTLRLKQLTEGMLVSVFAYKKDGIWQTDTLYGSKGEIRGFLSGIDSENGEIAIDETYFKYDKLLQSEIDMLMLGIYRSFYLDYKGKIAYVNYEVSGDNNKGVGYLIKTAPQSGLKSGTDLKIFDSNNYMRILTAREKLYVDGVLKTGDDIWTALDGATGMVAYTMYEDGRIRSIDFSAQKNYNNNSTLNPLDHLIYVGGGTNVLFRVTPKVFGNNMVCNDNVKIIILPLDIQNADDDEFFVTNNLGDIFRDGVRNNNAYCYSYNNNGIGVDYVVYNSVQEIRSNSKAYVVKKVTYQRNENDVFVPALQLMGTSGSETFICKDEAVLNNVTDESSNVCDVPATGDIIQFSTDMNGEITQIRMINDCSDEISGFKPNDFGSVDSYYGNTHIIKGNAYDKANGILLITNLNVADALAMENATNDDFEAYKMSLYTVIKVDGTGEVTKSSIENVKAYMKNNGEFSNVVSVAREGIPSLLIIYE